MSSVLGVVVLTRHGDREGFYQDPTTYTPTATAITPLGEQQSYQLGQSLRSVYLDPASPSAIASLAADNVLFSAPAQPAHRLTSQINRYTRLEPMLAERAA